jgi:hypothetical protein
VLGQEADLEVEVGALVGAACMRFWLMSTKVERKIASTEAHMASTTKDSSHCGTPGIQPRFATIQKPKKARWM